MHLLSLFIMYTYHINVHNSLFLCLYIDIYVYIFDYLKITCRHCGIVFQKLYKTHLLRISVPHSIIMLIKWFVITIFRSVMEIGKILIEIQKVKRNSIILFNIQSILKFSYLAIFGGIYSQILCPKLYELIMFCMVQL